MNLVDTHAHLNFPGLEENLTEVISDFQANNVKTIINVGTDLERSKTSINLAEKYEFIYATVGIHPTDTPEMDIDKETQELALLAENPKVIAIGECGLDFYRQESETERQRQITLFEKQIQIAISKNLPLVVHSRQAWPETLEVIKKSGIKEGVFHSWTYPPAVTLQALKETNFHFAFNGIVTFKNALEVAESAALVPLERLLLETDCPFLAPEPNRGLRNTPSSVKIVASKISDIKKTNLQKIAQTTTENAYTLFRINS